MLKFDFYYILRSPGCESIPCEPLAELFDPFDSSGSSPESWALDTEARRGAIGCVERPYSRL